MKEEERNQLLSHFLDSEIGEGEAEALYRELNRDPEFFRIVVDAYRVDTFLNAKSDTKGLREGILRSIRGAEQRQSQRIRLRDGVMNRVNDMVENNKVAVQRNKASRWSWWAVMAACLLISFGLYLGNLENENSSIKVYARVTVTALYARVFRDGQWMEVGQGIELGELDRVETRGEGGLRIKYRNESTIVTLHQYTQIEFLDSQEGKRISLKHGTVDFEVQKQPNQQSMKVRSLNAEVEILGTKFRYAVLSGKSEEEITITRLDVLKGLVGFRNLPDGEVVRVAEGQYAVAQSNITPLALNFSDERKKQLNSLWGVGSIIERVNTDLYGEVLFEDDFENGLENWDVVLESENSDGYDVLESNFDSYAEVRGEVSHFKEKVLGCLHLSPARPVEVNEKQRSLGIRSKRAIEAKSFVIEARMSFSAKGRGTLSLAGIEAYDGEVSDLLYYQQERKRWDFHRWEFRPVPEAEGVLSCRYFYGSRLSKTFKVRPTSSKIMITLATADSCSAYVDRVIVRELLDEK